MRLVDLESRLDFKNLKQYLTKKKHLQWAGHVMRMDHHRLPRKIITSWVENPRPKGRPQMTYGQCLENNLKKVECSILEWQAKTADWGWWRSFINRI